MQMAARFDRIDSDVVVRQIDSDEFIFSRILESQPPIIYVHIQ
jgi:hypothetical protein